MSRKPTKQTENTRFAAGLYYFKLGGMNWKASDEPPLLHHITNSVQRKQTKTCRGSWWKRNWVFRRLTYYSRWPHGVKIPATHCQFSSPWVNDHKHTQDVKVWSSERILRYRRRIRLWRGHIRARSGVVLVVNVASMVRQVWARPISSHRMGVPSRGDLFDRCPDCWSLLYSLVKNGGM